MLSSGMIIIISSIRSISSSSIAGAVSQAGRQEGRQACWQSGRQVHYVALSLPRSKRAFFAMPLRYHNYY